MRTSLPTTFMWKSEKNGLIIRQPEIEKPDITQMFGAYGNSPLFWTDSLLEFLLWKSTKEAKTAGNCHENMTVILSHKNNSLF